MGNKENAIQHCIEFLKEHSLAHIFDMATFNHVYRKQHAQFCNPVIFGLTAADYMIINQHEKQTLKTQN